MDELIILCVFASMIVSGVGSVATMVLIVRGQKMASAELEAVKAQVGEIKTLVAKVATDVDTLATRLLEAANGGATKDELVALANELGGIRDQLQAVDAKTPDEPAGPVDPPVDPETPETPGGGN